MRYMKPSTLRYSKNICNFFPWALRRFTVPVSSFFIGILVASCYHSINLQETNTYRKPDYDVLLSMKIRRDRVNAVCANRTGLTSEPNVEYSLVSKRQKLFYCPVEKVASTFWRRFLYQMDRTRPVSSPFDVGIRHALARMSTFFRAPGASDPSLSKVLNSHTTMIFVRDPYSRLFSAFVDKLIAPNPFYWRGWGFKAVQRFRPMTKTESENEICGNDVTFPEFISFVLKVGWSRDVHLMPIFRMCTPCSIRYDVIGKMETFFPDVLRIVELLGLDKNRLHLHRFRDDSIDDAIQDSVIDAMSDNWLKHSLKCVGKEEVVKRIWRKLQLRGVISWRQNFWLPPERIDTLEAQEYITILKSANKNSQNATELKLQKRQAMLEAFSLLSDVHFHNLLRIYGPDFELFKFNSKSMPTEANRPGTRIASTDAFNWTKNWNLAGIL